MPRLIGQQANVGSRILPLLILVVIAGGLLQYYGIIDVPGMGKRIGDELRSNDRLNQPVLADSSDEQFKLSLEERNA
jgi:hypothetical protein